MSSRCHLYEKEGERQFSNLFLHYVVTAQLWHMFLCMTEMNGSKTVNILRCWNGVVDGIKWWQLIPACIWLIV